MSNNSESGKISKQKQDLTDTINFSVDAGIVNRLGYELVGKAETAIAEIIKNSYDADATRVSVDFIDVNEKGGTLIIKDNGHGMDRKSIKDGFMRLSSTSKLKAPISPKFKRKRAGRKGIGRFATQRLGQQLTIMTKMEEKQAINVNVDWNNYAIDKDLSSIDNDIEDNKEMLIDGTTLIISDLREKWTSKQIERVYRYISELLKPNFEFDKETGVNRLKKQNEEDTFNVTFYKTTNGKQVELEDTQRFLFDNALATLEGYVATDKEAFCSVKSVHLDIEEEVFPVSASDLKDNTKNLKYTVLKDVHFKIYYYIFNRPEYYKDITAINLRKIWEQVRKFGSVWVYKNGFRVLPYGTERDDWLNIDRKRESVRTRLGINFNMPVRNFNLAGFVEIKDHKEDRFIETASREGLIENTAFLELRHFISKSIEISLRRVAEEVYKLKKNEHKVKQNLSSEIDSNRTTDELISDLKQVLQKVKLAVKDSADSPEKKNLTKDIKEAEEFIKRFIVRVKEELDEKKMLRVLAALGTTIGEFTHEITHFTGAFNGSLAKLYQLTNDKEIINSLDKMKRSYELFTTYTAHFESIVRKNARRELVEINLSKLIDEFVASLNDSSLASQIVIEVDYFDEKIITCPMHESEWHSLLFNLFTNAKKAILKKGLSGGKIKIDVYLEDEFIVVDFMDNGIGIKKEHESRVFNAFFTTSNISVDKNEMTGTGLGLKIVKDIITDYKGSIYLSEADEDFVTCFTIQIPSQKKKL